MSDDATFYDRALARLDRFILALAALGAVAAFIRVGWRAALGFAFGALLSWISLRLWKRTANSIGSTPSAPSAVFLGLRYLLLGGIVFVIIKFLEVSVLAILAGLFVSVAAILLEIVYELFSTSHKS